MPASPPEGGGKSKLIIVGAGVAVIVVAAAGVYFGTDLLKPSSGPSTSRVAEPMTKTAEAPPLPSFEDAKDAGLAGDNSLPSANSPVLPESAPPAQTQATKAQPEILPAPARRTNVPPAPTPSQMQRAAQDPVPGRAAKSQSSISASRGGATAGILKPGARRVSMKSRPPQPKRSRAFHRGPR